VSKLSKPQLTALIIILGVAVILVVNWYKESLISAFQKGISARAKGQLNAPIQIIEYIDFQCPACARGSKFLKKCFQKYSDKFYLEVKNYPLAMHPHSFLSARYAQCAAKQKKFWPFHDLIIDRQDQWKNLANAVPAFQKIAQDSQMDIKNLEVCLQDKKIEETIVAEKEDGASRGVQSTPTYFINGKIVVGYKLLEEELVNLFKQGGYGELVCYD